MTADHVGVVVRRVIDIGAVTLRERVASIEFTFNYREIVDVIVTIIPADLANARFQALPETIPQLAASLTMLSAELGCQ